MSANGTCNINAFLLYGAKDLRATDLPEPVAGPGDVEIAMRRTGICGSDMHYFSHGQVGSFVPKTSFVLGHEFAGESIGVGTGLAPAPIGGRVTVVLCMPCGNLGFDRGGRYTPCQDMRFYGSARCDPQIKGGFQKRIVAPAAACFGPWSARLPT